MSRTELRNRRGGITTKVKWTTPGGHDHNIIITIGIDDGGMVREIFVAGFRAESQLNALANDATIVLSRLLQFGVNIEEIAGTLCENSQEGQTHGPPASMLGAIVREAARIQREEAPTLRALATQAALSSELLLSQLAEWRRSQGAAS